MGDVLILTKPIGTGTLLAEQGGRSTLYPDNFKVSVQMELAEPDSARTALLFDPQTAGGLLAAVSAESADEKRA